MEEKEYKKSYIGLVLWLVFFIAAMTGAAFLPIDDKNISIRITINLCTTSVALLSLTIYLTGYVYWYNGIDYDTAKEAGEKRRKAYAKKHFVRFGIFAAVCIVFSVVGQLVSMNYGIDVTVVSIGMIVTAISTVGIKL